MPQRSILGWQVDAVGLVMTAAAVRRAAARTRQWDVDAGGRFDVRGGRTIVVWNDAIHPDGGRTEMIGSIRIRWNDPNSRCATIAAIAWDPAHAKRKDLLAAVSVLLGGDLHQFA